MSVCLVWLGDPAKVEVVMASPGPWREVIEAGTGMLVVETDETVSRVFHEIKWLLPDDCGLLVAPVGERPKARGVTPGTVSWLRERLPLPDRD
ncbi:MAG TPA: hypothetical protein VNS81_10235 [Nocardioides sp.]|nr:hypothetical protein [Nocardioides sp.]